MNKITRPFLKWAGGKRQLLPILTKSIPKSYDTYFEPFVGAGALLFDLQPKKAVINDTNKDLINCYIVIRENLDELIENLKKYKNEEEYFYQIRDLDRKDSFRDKTPVEKASRTIFLNKTCYNGLFRVNSQGYFNVPFGRYKNPKYVDSDVLKSKPWLLGTIRRINS
jgi:DNA adenine methylase